MGLSVVALKPPPGAEQVVELFEQLLSRAKAGEFSTVVVVAFAPSGAWLTVESGERRSRLETVGILESIKADVLATTEN